MESTSTETSSASPGLITPRLTLMMFLQYAVWGAWLPILGRYLAGQLGFSGEEIGWIVGAAGAVGAIFAPFIAGQIADRVFAAERFLCVSMLVGGVVQYLLASQTGFWTWLILSCLYSIIYMPTIAISNSLAFSHLRDPGRQFPSVRLGGTLGWIAVSWVFPMVWLQTGLHTVSYPPYLVGDERPDVMLRLADAMRLSGILSFAYGIYCLTLPHTPPRKSVESLAFAKAFGLLANPGLAIVTLVALPISIIHTIYFIQTPNFLPTLEGMRTADVQQAMSIGQFSEIFVLAALGFFVRRIGFRWLLTIGCLAYFARFMIFSLGSPTGLVVASQALHGVCFACFYATAFIYVERVAPNDVRHSAQTVFGIIILGLGPLLAGPVVGQISRYATREGVTIQECAKSVNLIPQRPPVSASKKDTGPQGWDRVYVGANAEVAAFEKANPNDQSRSWKALKPEARVTALDYKAFWSVVALIGLAGGVLLAMLFQVDPAADE